MNITMYDVGPSLNQETLIEIEKKINRKLPQEYKDFMLQYNGGGPDPNTFGIQWSEHQDWGDDEGELEYLLSVYDDPDANFLNYHRTYDGRIPRDTIAIGFDAGGNLILLGTGKSNWGNVFYWAHSYETEDSEKLDYSNVGLVANSFNEFIDTLYDDEEQD